MESLVHCVCGQFVKRKRLTRQARGNKHLRKMLDKVDDIVKCSSTSSVEVKHAFDHDTCTINLSQDNQFDYYLYKCIA